MPMDAEALREYLDWYKSNFANIFAKHEDILPSNQAKLKDSQKKPRSNGCPQGKKHLINTI